MSEFCFSVDELSSMYVVRFGFKPVSIERYYNTVRIDLVQGSSLLNTHRWPYGEKTSVPFDPNVFKIDNPFYVGTIDLMIANMSGHQQGDQSCTLTCYNLDKNGYNRNNFQYETNNILFWKVAGGGFGGVDVWPSNGEAVYFSKGNRNRFVEGPLLSAVVETGASSNAIGILHATFNGYKVWLR